MTAAKISLFTCLKRGAFDKCPRCGKGHLFREWGLLEARCPNCALAFEENEGDTWGFMYFSTGFLTGLFILGMFLVKPANRTLGFAVVIVLSLTTMFGTQKIRKGMAVGFDYWVRQGTNP